MDVPALMNSAILDALALTETMEAGDFEGVHVILRAYEGEDCTPLVYATTGLLVAALSCLDDPRGWLASVRQGELGGG